MKLLLYFSVKSSNNARLQTHIESAIQNAARLEICRSLKALHKKFQAPNQNISVAVLATSTLNELQELQKMKKYIHDLRLILILPDNNQNTIELAHKLRPRFVTTIHSDLHVAAVVLQKMISSEINAPTQEAAMI